MVLKPVGNPEAFIYASPGAGHSFSAKTKITDILIGQAEENKHIYTDEEILFEYKNRVKLPVIKMQENKLFDELLSLLKNRKENIIK